MIVYVDGSGVPYSTTTSERVGAETAPSTTSEISLSTSKVVLSKSDIRTSSSSAKVQVEAALSTTSEIALSTSAVRVTSSPSAVTPQSTPQAISEKPKSASTTPSSKPTAVDTTCTTTTLTPSLVTPEYTSPTSTSTTSTTTTKASGPAPQSPPPAKPAPTEQAGADTMPLGITWDAYTDSSGCKSPAQVASEFSRMKDYKVIRIYGKDCNQIALAVQNALKNGQKLMGGAYVDTSGGGEDVGDVIQTYKNAIDQYAGGNWDVIQLFSVENERINERRMTAQQVVDVIGSARAQLRRAGYNGLVGATETAPATIDNPSICAASDVVMVNIHAFFDRNTQAADAGPFVQSQVQLVKFACNNKRVVVTESGWPHQGNANGAAVPSPENQRAALDSIRAAFSSDMFLFSSFDSGWKANTASTFNAERFWGIL